MKKKFLLLSILLITSITSFAQKPTKIYYDKEWKGCSKSKASFYCKFRSYPASRFGDTRPF